MLDSPIDAIIQGPSGSGIHGETMLLTHASTQEGIGFGGVCMPSSNVARCLFLAGEGDGGGIEFVTR